MNRRQERRSPAGQGKGFEKTQRAARDLPDQFITTPRRWAPFARQIIDAKDAGAPINAYIFATADAWARAKARPQSMALPPGDDPEQYRWPALDAVVIIATDKPECFAASVARSVCADGTRYACAIHNGRDPIHCWIDGAERAEAIR